MRGSSAARRCVGRVALGVDGRLVLGSSQVAVRECGDAEDDAADGDRPEQSVDHHLLHLLRKELRQRVAGGVVDERSAEADDADEKPGDERSGSYLVGRDRQDESCDEYSLPDCNLDHHEGVVIDGEHGYSLNSIERVDRAEMIIPLMALTVNVDD